VRHETTALVQVLKISQVLIPADCQLVLLQAVEVDEVHLDPINLDCDTTGIAVGELHSGQRSPQVNPIGRVAELDNLV